jgi:hypothetical protein
MFSVRRHTGILFVSALLVMSLVVTTAIPMPARSTTITVSGTPWGLSTCYIGATEGNVRFDIADLQEAGIATYRVYGGMPRWEWRDDDGVYGAPTIAEIKENPAVINWTWWDTAMTYPPRGSDYWWSGTDQVWQGNARTIFAELQAAGIRPVLTLRNVDNYGNPSWGRRLNPPRSPEDWNEWWEHVFATVFWLNVRNNYGVNDFEVGNEPNNSGQGWGGTIADYDAFIQYTYDAISFVYHTYLPGRTFHVYAPVTSGGDWPRDVMMHAGASFDTVDVHNYNSDITGYTEHVHGWMKQSREAGAELWLTEWATYLGGYQSASTGVNTVLNNMIRGARPGQDHIDGSHLFTFYDWAGSNKGTPDVDWTNFQGLVGPTGSRRASFYALRMGTRALNRCKASYQTTTGDGHVLAITTKDAEGKMYLLVTNSSEDTPYAVKADLSALISSGTGTMWQFDATHNDVIVDHPTLSNGHVAFTIPATAAIMIRFSTPVAEPPRGPENAPSGESAPGGGSPHTQPS